MLGPTVGAKHALTYTASTAAGLWSRSVYARVRVGMCVLDAWIRPSASHCLGGVAGAARSSDALCTLCPAGTFLNDIG